MSPLRVLVAGGTGFVGAAIVRRLRAEGAEVVVASRATGFDFAADAPPPVAAAIDVVVHAAASPVGWSSPRHPEAAYLDHARITRNLLALARRKDARVVLTSTWVYGAQPRVPAGEDDEPRPHTPYAASRLAAERLAVAAQRDDAIAVDVLRLCNVYGPGQQPSFVVPRTVAGALAGCIELADPAPRRDYIHVDDVARAFALAARRSGGGADVFNVGSGVSRSLDELARTVARFAGGEVEIRYGRARREVEIADACADIGKATRILGWTPEIAFEPGVAALVRAAKEARR